MAYDTAFTLDVHDAGGFAARMLVIDSVCSAFVEQVGFDPFFDMFDWVNYEKDAAAVSALFPDHYIMISGDGEDGDDQWRDIWKGGTMAGSWSNPGWPTFIEVLNGEYNK